MQIRTSIVVTLLPILGLLAPAVWAAPVSMTILHTNDIHSHFRGEMTPMGTLGGVARMKTVFDRVRTENPNTLIVDGGDWSEGNIYYNEGAGLESLRIMDSLGYDAIVIGNHDWLNGPDHLLNTIEQIKPEAAILGANLKLRKYDRKDEWERWVPPYVLKKVGAVTVAIIGLVTREFIYEDYLKPIKVEGTVDVTQKLSKKLKHHGVDAVIVVSHNGLSTNRSIAKKCPDVDLVIGAHDHARLTRPLLIGRNHRNAAWVVETGEHGHTLGRVDLVVTPSKEAKNKHKTVDLRSYKLIQIDSRIEEDPEVLAEIERLEENLTRRYGPIFNDTLGYSELEVSSVGVESQLGSLLTDAYRAETGAEIAFDHSKMVYRTIHEGTIRTADVFNTNPAVYNPQTGKAWTLKTLPMRGGVLKTVLSLFYSLKKLTQFAPISVSGLQVTFNPRFSPFWTAKTVGGAYIRSRYHPLGALVPDFIGRWLFGHENEDRSIVGDVLVNGVPLDVNRTYKVAIGGGITEALLFLNRRIPGFIPMKDLYETNQEDWRILANHVQAMSPLTSEKMPIGLRIRTLAPDLGVLYQDIQWSEVRSVGLGFVNARLTANIKNYGATVSPAGVRVHILINRHGADLTHEPEYIEGGASITLPEIAPGQSLSVTWAGVTIPRISEGNYPVTIRIAGNTEESNAANDEFTRYFRLN